MRSRLLTTGIVVLAVIGCERRSPVDPPDDSVAEPDPRLARIELDADTTLLTAIGQSVQLIARGFDENNAPFQIGVLEWRSSDSSIATVDSTGLVEATGNGRATITAGSGTVVASIAVTVEQQVQSLSISEAPELTLSMGASIDLVATPADRNGHAVAHATVTWVASPTSVVTVSQDGRVTARGPGSAVVSASVGEVRDSVDISVVPLTARRVNIDPYLATPAAGALWEIPVLIVSYIPTADGTNLDLSKSPDFYTLGPMTLAQVEAHLQDIFRRKKMALEEGSRFRAYSNPTAPPSIGIRVVEHINVYTQLPASPETVGSGLDLQYRPDYKRAFREIGIDTLIPKLGVRQVWLAQSSFSRNFPSYDPGLHDPADALWVAESNMSSPTTGDISNSFRHPDDLPVFDHTYVVYGIAFRRSQAEAVHNVGHQMEAILSHINERYDRSTRLFWNRFVGLDASGKFVQGRAGSTHFPPNAVTDYDYTNPVAVSSDIEDWRPDGSGTKKPVNAATWGNRSFPWPGAPDFPQRVETQWYIHWFQSMPGRGNTIPLGSGTMTNWWYFFADWDAAIRDGVGLATVRDGQPISIRNDFTGGILLSPGGGLEPGQSVELYSDDPLEVGVWDCGEPGATVCIFDEYVLVPGRSYRVMQHPDGPPNNLTIVER